MRQNAMWHEKQRSGVEKEVLSEVCARQPGLLCRSPGVPSSDPPPSECVVCGQPGARITPILQH